MKNSLNSSVLALCLALSCAGVAHGQLAGAAPARRAEGAGRPYDERARDLLASPEIRAAFAHVERSRDEILREWIAITEINAPSGKEGARADFIERLLRSYKSLEVRRDGAGNVVATRRGAGRRPPRRHRRAHGHGLSGGLEDQGGVRGGNVYAPGVGDDTRNIEAMLATIRALDAAGVKTRGDLVFLFTVEEETNFRGVEEFVKENKGQSITTSRSTAAMRASPTAASVSTGTGTTSSAPAATRARRRRPTRRRSRGARHRAHLPLQLPQGVPANLNIGMLGGADVVNAKAADAWFTVDLRSTSNEVIADLEKKIATIVREEAERERMTVKTELISSTPAAQIPGTASPRSSRRPRPSTTRWASGRRSPSRLEQRQRALLAGIPAISTGAGPCRDSHALTESCEIEPLYKGIQKVLALGVAMAELSR